MAGNLMRALVVEYRGTGYGGFQYQENADTVQRRIEAAAQKLFSAELKIRAASRTDSGVHARGQVVSLNLPAPFPQENLVPALNFHLPWDIRILKAYAVPDNFHPQKWARGKIYRYYIYNRHQPSAIFRDYTWHLSKPLDIGLMNQAAQLLRGTHDFASFRASGPPVTSTVRTIWRLHCQRQKDQVIITCAGDGFLHNMVRIITGTLVEVGLGKRAAKETTKIIAEKDRRGAGKTAPAHGLFLEKVLYRPSLDTYQRL